MIAAVLVTLAFLGFSALLAGDLRRQASRDTFGLKAARAEVVADIHRQVKADQLAGVDRLRVPASFWADGRRRLDEFHREDR